MLGMLGGRYWGTTHRIMEPVSFAKAWELHAESCQPQKKKINKLAGGDASAPFSALPPCSLGQRAVYEAAPVTHHPSHFLETKDRDIPTDFLPAASRAWL